MPKFIDVTSDGTSFSINVEKIVSVEDLGQNAQIHLTGGREVTADQGFKAVRKLLSRG